MSKYTGYELFRGDPHALCQVAEEDLEKIYQDSCVEAIRRIITKNNERLRAIADSEKLAKSLVCAYDDDDRELVANILSKINNR